MIISLIGLAFVPKREGQSANRSRVLKLALRHQALRTVLDEVGASGVFQYGKVDIPRFDERPKKQQLLATKKFRSRAIRLRQPYDRKASKLVQVRCGEMQPFPVPWVEKVTCVVRSCVYRCAEFTVNQGATLYCLKLAVK